ncbi:L-histidine N(alpha)-methyltransferase [Arachidicoccus terrestris]|uniref:L-histidine N(alpha)-methyltransferase n=1 Tax=Arachidicoccus terrestris TaxID=2875539 RepID=UPI001CC6E40C|nr:L-histidine N(alpha)-methyltransferase [Arachidicoccus terrestris]UAY56007.1 L-histidine N(alpha)-methyltransferase [Arachidicoccus terrestris]
MIAIADSRSETMAKNKDFYIDVIQGLSKSPKKLSSKYFYDKTGDRIFEQIMSSPDYYLTKCEMEIFKEKSDTIAEYLIKENGEFDLIELGPGNCAKSIHLLRSLVKRNSSIHYIPIDISESIIRELQVVLPGSVPGLIFEGRTGDYFDQLGSYQGRPGRRKVVLCLGGNIGNMSVSESCQFCHTLRSHLHPGDQCIIGFDLIKHPEVIRRAYDDRDGFTREFNLNLLQRINRELDADFDMEQFDHYCSYDPLEGAAKSYLICKCDMTVKISGILFHFKENEPIWTEISQKFTKGQIQKMADSNSFIHSCHFSDTKSWFMDAVWTAI